jgi:hypothetical protein
MDSPPPDASRNEDTPPAPPRARRAARLVPAAIVVACLGVVAWRIASTRDVAPREDAIRARWESRSDFPVVAKQAEEYLRDFGDDRDARAFAAEAFLRAEEPVRAFDAAFSRGSDAGARVRFARDLLSLLARRPEGPTRLESHVLVARADADEPGARDALRERVRTCEPSEFVFWFGPASHARTPATQVVGRALFARPEEPARIAGAVLLSAPKSGADLAPLRKVLPTAWRYEHRPMWHRICRGLGVSGDPRDAEALRAERERLAAPGFDPKGADRLVLDMALALSGDAAARERAEAAFEKDASLDMTGTAYAEGLAVRADAGDRAAYDALVRLAERAASAEARTRALYGLVVCERLAPPEVPLERIARAAEAKSDEFARALALVWRYRVESPGAAAETERALRSALSVPEATSASDADGESGPSGVAFEVARAWLRWKR